jgi:hypothetical protein
MNYYDDDMAKQVTNTAMLALARLIDDVFNNPVEKLNCDFGKVYGKQYHTVEPIGGNWRTMEEWCTEQFGSTGSAMWGVSDPPVPAERWYMNNRKFWFRDERDQMLFVLKWS